MRKEKSLDKLAEELDKAIGSSNTPDEDDYKEFEAYELEFCEQCFQMTNHLDGDCQKCKHHK